MTLKILAQNKDWLIVDKPAELSVHNEEPSVLSVLTTQLSLRQSPLPVHRLDVGTSGVLLLALNPKSARELAEAFSQETTTKTYLAVLKGQISTATEWNFPLTDKAEGRRDPAGKGERKTCKTYVTPLKSSRYFTLCEMRLETGRTHQIRRHAALAKSLVVGDERYGSQDYAEKLKAIYGLDRLALHAHRLEIEISGKLEIFESTPPEIFEKLLV